MAFLISPGVQVREFNLATVVPAVSTSVGAIAGVFHWGPIDERVLVDDETVMVQRFGKPSNLNAETWFTGASFLGYTNALLVSRAGNTAGKSPSVTCNTSSANTTVTLSTGNTADLEAGMILISSGNSGLAVGAVIDAITNTTAFTVTSSADVLATKTNDALQFVSNTVFSAVANSGAVANLEYQIVKNETHFTEKDGNFDTDVKFVARYPGEDGNSLRVSVCGNSSGYNSTINLASYGTRVVFQVNVNSNSAVMQVMAAANADADANATTVKALLNVTDTLEVGNSSIGTQFLKITALSNNTNYGTTASNLYVVSTSGNTVVAVVNSTGGSEAAAANTDGIVAGQLISAGNTNLLDLVVNNVINSTAFNTTVAPGANVTTAEVTFSPRTIFTVSFEDPFTLSSNYKFLSSNTSTRGLPRYWEFHNLVDKAPGQSDYHISFGNSSVNSDEMHIVVVDEGGKFTGVPGTILETYRNVSRATDAKTIDGSANYYRTVINDASQFVYAVNDISGATSNTAVNLTSSTLDIVSYRMTLGRNGKDESNLELASILAAYDLFKSAEDVDVSLVLQGKARSYTLANYLIDNINETRKDCVSFISPQKGDVVNNKGNEASACVSFKNNLRSSSYYGIDSGYKYMYDRYNDVYRWIPLNGDHAGLYARTDLTNDSWWSAAGFNRGHIKNVVKLAWNPRQAERDVLYKANINPVVTFPGQGTILYGDKTGLSKPSAFDRMNVRRLFITLEKAIATAAKYMLFEFNDAFTRSQFKNLVVPYLREIQGKRGIYDFLVVCDSSNNPGTVIDRNEFVGDIYIKPARSINFIQLNFVAVGTSVAFSEVVGQFG